MQQIICQRGRCFDAESVETRLQAMFDETNIVHRIQRDIAMSMLS